MNVLRPALGLAVALLLAVTSLSLAVARGQPPVPAGQIVICTGMGLQAVAVDAEGQPVGRAHVCPDGLAALAATALALPVLPARDVRPARVPHARPAPPLAGRERVRPRMRGPPAAAA